MSLKYCPFVSRYSGDLAKRRILKHFVTFCHNELHDIDICNECYCNANEHPTDWFTKVCEHPHILLWARHGDNYWPAKAMAVRKSDDRIHVRFFGHGCRNAYVEMSECFLYSTKHPKAIDYTRLDSHKDAQRVSSTTFVVYYNHHLLNMANMHCMHFVWENVERIDSLNSFYFR